MEYINFFEEVEDYRVTGRCLHLLSDILMLSFCAFLLLGAEDFEEVEDYGKEKLSFLSTFLQLDNGIPSHDTINRVFGGILPTQFSTV